MLDKAIAYVKENLPDYERAIINASIDKAYAMHLAPSNCVNVDPIIDLLEEYGQDNDLPESYWEEDGDIDDILFQL